MDEEWDIETDVFLWAQNLPPEEGEVTCLKKVVGSCGRIWIEFRFRYPGGGKVDIDVTKESGGIYSIDIDGDDYVPTLVISDADAALGKRCWEHIKTNIGRQ